MDIKNLLLTMTACVAMLIAATGLSAQQRDISGVISDEKGVPVPGMTIIVEGTQIGAVSDANGVFRIKAGDKSVLVVSGIGYKTEKVTVAGKTTVNIVVKEESQLIDGVVVTALGITRSEKSLGYSVAKIGNEEMTNTMSNNWLDGLAGKVAGLTFDQAAAGPSGSIRVTLRGESSLDPTQSEALFIVDGVPLNNAHVGSTSSSGFNTTGVDMPIDYGNGVSDLNPDDIENVTVLKGAAATALYGSRAANGAIIITTKGGHSQKGVGVTVSSWLTFENASFWPDFQNEYGAGAANSLQQEQVYSFYTFRDPSDIQYTRSTQHTAWGPRFEGQLFYQYNALQPDGSYIATPWQAQDWYKGFFETGITYYNFVSIEGNNGRGTSTRISFSDRHNEWITPNTGSNRQTVTVSALTPLNRWVKFNIKANYNRRQSDNLPMSGLGRSTIPYALMWSAPSINTDWYRDYPQWVEDYGTSQPTRNNTFYTNSDGPYFQAYEQLNTMDRHRIYGTTDLSIDITPKINLMLRTGLDISTEFRTQRKPFNSHAYANGRYREQLITRSEFNSDFLLKYEDKFGDFGLKAMAGGNIMSYKSNSSATLAVSLEVPGQYTLSNSINQLLTTPYRSNKQINSLYGMFQMSYKSYVFVDITGRNDWSSTLRKGYNSYFYPAVSTSMLFSEIFKLPKKIDLLKLRVSWANVGNDTNPYVINNSYQQSSFGGGVRLPLTFADDDIKPEMVDSWEFGLEGKFFKGRIGFDASYYHATSYNQIMRSPVDPATGYYQIMFNAGKLTNSGWEITLNAQPIRTSKFRWNTSVVYSRNKNEVKELVAGAIDNWIISTSGRAQVEARVGGTLGAIYGTGFERVPDGTIITLEDGTSKDISGEMLFDAVTGYPIINNAEHKYLGDTQPKWKGGINNLLSYKGFKLSVSIDGQFGGRAYSYSHALLSYTGKLKNSLPGRYEGIVGDGYCYDATNDTYYKNKTVSQYISGYYDRYYRSENIESNVFSTSFIKLREARLEYNLPKKLLNNTKVLQGLTIAVYGRNLAMWTEWPIFNPEVASLNGSDIMVGLEAGAFPMTRSYGVNVKLKF